jgi:hypothetical protein
MVKAAESIEAKGRKAQGDRTRRAILESAVHIASAEGLEGLTIGRLASDLSMSKSRRLIRLRACRASGNSATSGCRTCRAASFEVVASLPPWPLSLTAVLVQFAIESQRS